MLIAIIALYEYKSQQQKIPSYSNTFRAQHANYN